MAIFGNLFDFNHDGKLDSLEKAAEMDFFLEQVDRDNRTLSGVVSNTHGEKTLSGREAALEEAKKYLNIFHMSHEGMSRQLESDGFSAEDAKYGADHCGADWKEQARMKATEYVKDQALNAEDMERQLEYEGFTDEQVTYAIAKSGLKADK